MLFDEKFIENIQDEPIVSIIKAIEICNSNIHHDPFKQHWEEQEYDDFMETYYLVSTIVTSFNLEIPIENEINLTGDILSDCNKINSYLDNIKEHFIKKSNLLKAESLKSKFHREINNVFAYEFSQGDLDRIQVLINELREEIKKSDLFDDKHKERLLKRLEKLQAEMHKKMSNVDIFWGLIGDAGVVLGKFGKDSKPFVDRIREISDIVWRTQSRAEELPSNTPSPTVIEAEIIDE